MAKKSYWEENKVKRIFKYVVIYIIVFVTLFPIFWMFSTSFKPPLEWTPAKPVWITKNPTFNNYVTVFLGPGRAKGGWYELSRGEQTEGTDEPALKVNIKGESSLFLPLFTSLLVCSSATFLSIIIGILTAYSISRYKFGGNFFSFFILSGRMFPPIAVVIPLVVMFSVVGFLDTYVGLIIAYTGFTLPFSVWMIKSFIDEIPHELEEAAIVDGMTNFQAILRVTIPLTKGGIAATALFIFIINWGEFLVAFLLSSTKVITIPILLSKYFTTVQGRLYGPQAALGIIASIPVIIFAFLIQKHLVRGLTFGAIKR